MTHDIYLLGKCHAIAWLRQCAIILIDCKRVSAPRTRRRRARSCPESLCTTRTSFLTWNVWSSFGKRSPGPLCSPGHVWEGLSRRSRENQGLWLASNSHGRVFDRGAVYAMDAAHCLGNEHSPNHCNRMQRARVGGVRRGAETEAKTEKVGTITAAMNELEPRSKPKLKLKSAMRKPLICTSCHKKYRHTEPRPPVLLCPLCFPYDITTGWFDKRNPVFQAGDMALWRYPILAVRRMVSNFFDGWLGDSKGGCQLTMDANFP